MMDKSMAEKTYQPGESYNYPLIIKKLLNLGWEEDRLLDVTIKTGRPLPLVELEVFDAQGRALPHGGKLPEYGVPDLYAFVDEVPKTSVGKLDKKKLRKLCAASHLKPPPAD